MQVFISQLCGGGALPSIPELDVGRRMGSTQYIDYIRVEDMSHFIMKGKDMLDRPFLSVQVHIARYEPTEEEKEVYSYVLTKEMDIVGTFFQRYKTGSGVYAEEVIAYGTAYPPSVFFSSGALTGDSYKNMVHVIVKLCSGQTVVHEDSWNNIFLMTIPAARKVVRDLLETCVQVGDLADLCCEFI
jgi:hypothetical protein